MSDWIRRCQECGLDQKCPRPTNASTGEMTEAYRERKCKRCKSSGLDFGSDCASDANEHDRAW